MVRMSLDRRQFLTRTGAAAVGAAGTLGVPVIADAAAKASKRGSAGRTDPLLADGTLQRAVVSDPSARLPAVPFRGRHQAGLPTRRRPPHASPSSTPPPHRRVS